MILLTISSILLIGCRTPVPDARPEFNVPAFPAPPVRPTLETIPSDTTEAIRALTINMSRLVNGWQQWEIYDEKKEAYYRSVIDIITR